MVFLQLQTFQLEEKTFVSDKQEKMMRGNKGNDHMMRIMLMLRIKLMMRIMLMLTIMLMLVSMKLSMVT